MIKSAKRLFSAFLGFLYPELCASCGELLMAEENSICLKCELVLPQTKFCYEDKNIVEQKFWGRIPLEHASSFYFFYKGGHVQHLVHNIKYNGYKNAAINVGSLIGIDLHKSGNYSHIDYIVPVPLHKSREMQRGYNQSLLLAEGISKELDAQVSAENLRRIRKSESQTKKSRDKRAENVKDIFSVKNPAEYQGKHLLLIDDVITTGATLEACANILLKNVKDVKLSIATLAIASEQ